MFCSKCGKEIKENAKFCTFCGQPVQRQTEVQGGNIPVKMRMSQLSPQNGNQPGKGEEDDKTVLLVPPMPNIFAQNENSALDVSRPVLSNDKEPKKKRHGIFGLVILLIVLVFIALGCLFFIIYIQKSDDSNMLFGKNSDTEQIEDHKDMEENDDIDGQFAEEDEVAEDGENTAAPEVDYLEQAQEAFAVNDYVLALQYCGMALQADSSSEDAYSLEADIYLAQQEIEQAAIVLSEGVAITGSGTLEYKKDQLIADVITTSCSQYNSLGTLICEVEYDASGNAIRYTSYSDGQNISSIEECQYDSWGRNTGKSYYNSNMSLEWKETYDYNSAGYMSKCTHYNSKNKKEWYDEYTYDANGRQIETTRYNADGTLSWWDEYTYISDENYSKTAHPSSGTTVVFQYTCAFDQFGNQIEFAEYDATGTCNYTWQKEYNGLGDVTKYIYGDSEINYIYDYAYR